MSTMHVFWTLVRNDARLGFAIRREDKAIWKIFSLAALLMGVGIGLYSSDLFAIRFIFVLNIIATSPGISILVIFLFPFNIAQKMLPAEWKNGTVGWWLSLPYSRKFLMAAKSMAGFSRFIKLLLIFVIPAMSLTILTIYLHQDISEIVLLNDLPRRILYYSAIAILLSPTVFILGNTLTVLGKSQMNVLTVLLTALTIIGVIFLMFTRNIILSPDSFGSAAWHSLLSIFGFSMGLSALFFFLGAYVLEHKVDI